MFRAQCSSSGETNCINTASGNSHSMLVDEMCAGWKNTLPTCTHLGHQHRMTVTRGCIDTILFLLMMSTTCWKHVESYK